MGHMAVELGKAVWRRLGLTNDEGPWLRVESWRPGVVNEIQRQRRRAPGGVEGTWAAQSRGHPPVVLRPQGHQTVVGTRMGSDGDL